MRMDSTDFFAKVAKARTILERSTDYIALQARGHQLVGGAALTCASDVPWQLQVRCSRCAGVFWFDNLAWRDGGADRWKLSVDSREHATAGCAGAGITAAQFLAPTHGRNLLQGAR